MTDDSADGELMARVARGDGAALEQIHEQHGHIARLVAYRVLRNSTLAEDASQEALLDLWRTADSFDPTRASIRTWLSVLAHRRAVDLARREARRRVVDGTAAGLDPQSYVFDEMVVLETERRRVQAALAGLNERNRELIELSYWGGLSQSQIAEQLGLPLGTVKSATFNALAQLRLVLATAA